MTGPARKGADLLFVLGLALFWGLNWPAVRTALDELPPWTLRSTGMGAGALFLMALAAMQGARLRLRAGEWLPILGSGFLAITAFNLLLAFAQLAAPTSRAVIITFTMPVWTVLFARLILGETLDRPRIAGLGLGVAGLISLGWPLIAAGELSHGLVLALLAGMSWALGTVLIKRFPVAAPPVTITAWQLVAGALVAGIGMLVFEPEVIAGSIRWRELQGRTWAALGYHILFSQALAYLIWYRLLARLPAGTISLSMLLVPAIGVISSILVLGERPGMADLIGLVLMTAAAAAVNLPWRWRPRRSARI